MHFKRLEIESEPRESILKDWNSHFYPGHTCEKCDHAMYVSNAPRRLWVANETIILTTQKHMLKLIVNFTLKTCVYLNWCKIKWQNRWNAGTTGRFLYEICVKESFMCSCGQTETVKHFLVLDKLAF